ncbi:hypothetical protein [Novosphingobium mathurense]|uniref:hypothetical protein n=1 Tax=Novosphingobium mathurense TaxID=428990 RepID=UPI0011168A55|nr:hypothetical protein [Novosphingobium mathurense]
MLCPNLTCIANNLTTPAPSRSPPGRVSLAAEFRLPIPCPILFAITLSAFFFTVALALRTFSPDRRNGKGIDIRSRAIWLTPEGLAKRCKDLIRQYRTEANEMGCGRFKRPNRSPFEVAAQQFVQFNLCAAYKFLQYERERSHSTLTALGESAPGGVKSLSGAPISRSCSRTPIIKKYKRIMRLRAHFSCPTPDHESLDAQMQHKIPRIFCICEHCIAIYDTVV